MRHLSTNCRPAEKALQPPPTCPESRISWPRSTVHVSTHWQLHARGVARPSTATHKNEHRCEYRHSQMIRYPTNVPHQRSTASQHSRRAGGVHQTDRQTDRPAPILLDPLRRRHTRCAAKQTLAVPEGQCQGNAVPSRTEPSEPLTCTLGQLPAV